MKALWKRLGTQLGDGDPAVAAISSASTMQISGSKFIQIGQLNVHQGDSIHARDYVHLGDNVQRGVHITINTSQTGFGSKRIERPWETWNLDDKFLRSLSAFCVDHPDMRLEVVLERVNLEFEQGNDISELIPDSSFPACALVKALTCLLRLGHTVKRSNNSTRRFVEQVVSWINKLTSAYLESDVNYEFTWVTWQGLRKMRDLVDEICSWANSRLVDGRWSQISHGLMIAKEIDGFNTCIDQSNALFKDLTIINLTGGMSAIKDAVTTILLRQDRIREEIRKIKKQQHKHSTHAMNEKEAKDQAEARRVFLEATLNRRVVENPTYDEQGKNPCDEGTRVAELANIKQWLNLITPGSQNFLWLTGDPGCGKSAITASLARDCKDDDVLWAQFFINRNNKETTDPNSYFPSIARQLVDRSPEVERAVYDRLKAKPSLMDRISSDQAAKLFVAALAVASKLTPFRVVVVIIDGLDETDKTHLKDTAVIFSHLFEELRRYPNVKVFISSRTEDDIRNPFARSLKVANVKHVHLDTADSFVDVSSFLRRKMAGIVEANDLNWEVWPTEARMEALAARASGLFIWAVTVAKFLQEQIDEQGTEYLDKLLDVLTGDNMKDINTLYGLITRVHMRHPTDWEFEKFRRIIGAIIVLREPLCLEDLSELLDLRETPGSSRVDMVAFVRRFRTVLVAGTDAIDGKTIPRLHKSFFEFITSPDNFSTIIAGIPLDARLCIDTEIAEGELVLCCLGHFRALYQQELGFGAPLSPSAQHYATRFWSSHLEYTTGKTAGTLLGSLTMSPYGVISTLSGAGISKLLTFSFSSYQPRLSVFWSPTEHHGWVSARHPSKVLQGHNGAVTCISFSFDGHYLVSGSEDKTVRLWNLQNGSELRFHDTRSHVMSDLAFSPSGKKIAGGATDGTVHVWDSQSLDSLVVLNAHKTQIYSIVFSPGGMRIAAASYSVCLVNAESYEMTGRQSSEPGTPISSLVFVSNGCQLASGSRDGLVRLWDELTCRPILTLPEEPTFLDSETKNRISTMAVSPDGNHIVAGGNRGLFSWIWQGERFDGPDILVETQGGIQDVVFSPDGTYLLVRHSAQPSIGCYDLRTRDFTPLIDGPDGQRILDLIWGSPRRNAFKFSPTGLQVASSTENVIHIENMPLRIAHKVSSIAISPDGNIILCAFVDHRVFYLDLTLVRPVYRLLRGQCDGEIEHAAFSSKATHIVGTTNKTIYLWQMSTQQLIASGEFSAPLVSLTLSTIFVGYVVPLTKHANGAEYLWNVVGETLVARSFEPGEVPPEVPISDFLHVDFNQGQIIGRRAQWFPAKQARSNFWAWIDGYFIIARAKGSVTVFPSR